MNERKLPPGWEYPKLSEIARINPPLDRCVLSDQTEVTFVPMRAVDEEGGGIVRPEIRAYGGVKKGYTSFLSGDVIMAKITPCMENGKTTVVPDVPGEVCFGSTEFHVLRAEVGVQARWLAQFLLQHDVRQAAQRKMAGGVGQMRVPAAFLEETRIPLSPAHEQIRIGEALDELLPDLDAGVSALERVRAKLKLYRASVLKAAVDGTLTAEWRAKHPDVESASELLKRILSERRRRWGEDQLAKFKAKDQEPPKNWKEKYKQPTETDASKLPELPSGWCWATLDQLAWESGYGTSQKCTETPDGIAVLRIPNIAGGKLDLDSLKYAPAEYSELENELVKIGDLLVVRTNGSRKLIGRGAVICSKPPIDLSFASYLIRLRIFPNSTLLRWISLLWDSYQVRHWIESRAATSAGQYNISLGILETLAIPVPPIAEQDVAVEVAEEQLSIIDHLEIDIDARLRAAQGLRQAVLHHAFSGKLVPQDANDEPASELLKRIAAEREARPGKPVKARRGPARR